LLAFTGSTKGPPSAIAGLFIGAHLGVLDDDGDAEGALKWLHIDMAGLVRPRECRLARLQVVAQERSTGYGVALLCALLGEHTTIDKGLIA